MEVVRATDRHPTAEWVYRKVSHRLRRISLGTVYRNLKLLVEQGLIHELDDRGLGRYDGNTVRHHHFTCRVCGRISDLTESVDRGLDSRVTSRTGLEIWHHRIEFYGRCATCRAKARRRAKNRTPR
jgi:Fe2+ or Zn2+ uptake regulation protein